MKKLIPAFLFLSFIVPAQVFGQFSNPVKHDPARDQAWQFFLSHLDEPLIAPNQSEQEYKRRLHFYDLLTGQENEANQIRFNPFRFQKFSSPDNRTSFVLLARPNIVPMPGIDAVRVFTFSSGGYESTRQTFIFRSRRYDLIDAKVEFQAHLRLPTVRISLKRKNEEGIVTTFFLAMNNHQWAIVRLENEQGKILPYDSRENIYEGFQPESGIIRPSRIILSEDDPIATLESLLWLGGIQDSSDKDTFSVCQLARNSPEVREKLKTLAASKNQWIREAAHLALSPPKPEEEQ
jgi:hypothetical protein